MQRTSRVMLCLLTAALCLSARAMATTYTVSNTDNDGAGSLRQAIADANGNAGSDAIDFSVTGMITLTSGQISITDDVM
jgi:hypothetical protein